MRYHLFIECMPTEELTPLEKERVSRMLALALNTERLKEMQLNASSLLSEVNTEYHRTMCSIIFDRLANQAVSMGDIDGIFGHINLPPPPARKPVPGATAALSGLRPLPSPCCVVMWHVPTRTLRSQSLGWFRYRSITASTSAMASRSTHSFLSVRSSRV